MTEIETQRFCVRDHDGDSPVAAHGRYCTRCWGRLDLPLSLAGELALHLVGSIVPSSSPSEDRVDGSREAPLPLNQAAFDDASELFAGLVYWVDVWAASIQQPAPVALYGAWRNERGRVVGLPAGVDPVAAGRAVGLLAKWIRDRLDLILTRAPEDDIDAFTETIGDVYRMNARWPRVEKPQYSKMPCALEGCGARIAVYPPAFSGDARRIVCTAGHFYPEELYEHSLLVFQQVRKEQVQHARAAAHLMKKYGDIIRPAREAS